MDDLVASELSLGELPAKLAQVVAELQHAMLLQKEAVQSLGTTNFFISITVNNGDSKTIHTGGGAFTANAPVVLGDQNQITSTTTVGSARPLDQELDSLTKLVEELAKRLPPQAAKEVKDDLASLKQEAAREQPRQKWYELSGAGLLEAAKSVADMAPSIAKSVGAVLGILGGPK